MRRGGKSFRLGPESERRPCAVLIDDDEFPSRYCFFLHLSRKEGTNGILLSPGQPMRLIRSVYMCTTCKGNERNE